MEARRAKLFATEMAPAVAVLIDRATRPLLDRIDELERRSVSYAGVWGKGTKYGANALVTHGGATWLSVEGGPAGERPGGASGAWLLTAKSHR